MSTSERIREAASGYGSDDEEYPECPDCGGRKGEQHWPEPGGWEPCSTCDQKGFLDEAEQLEMLARELTAESREVCLQGARVLRERASTIRELQRKLDAVSGLSETYLSDCGQVPLSDAEEKTP